MKHIDKKYLYAIGGAVIITAVFLAGLAIGNKTAYHVSQPDDIDFSLFWDSYQKLSQTFIDPSKIDKQKILYGAIQGMAESLGDPYTNFFNPSDAKIFQDDLAGSFEGIGAEIGKRDNFLTIIAPIEGTPAKQAGLQPGDIILKINDEDTTGMSVEEAVNRIRGKKGTKVVLSIAREDWTGPQDVTITRATITPENIRWSLKNGDVAYIEIFQFDRHLSADFAKTAKEIDQSGATKIIVDVRNNPGGYLDIAQEVAGYFLDAGQTVTIEDHGGDQPGNVYKAEGNAQFADYPAVVLINEGSASASEILAGALRDNRKVPLVGKKSFGKGSIQTILELPGGSLLKVTIAKWLTPAGHSISEVGLTPDHAVELTSEDREADKDPQLDKALEIIKALQ